MEGVVGVFCGRVVDFYLCVVVLRDDSDERLSFGLGGRDFRMF